VSRARCSRLEPEAAEGELELEGARGSASFAVATDRPYAELGRVDGAALARRGGWRRNALGRFGAGPDAGALPRSLAAELAAFAAGEADVASAADGVRCHAVLDALRDSAGRGGAWVPVTVAP
jgi:predicted dehydrogenase